MRRLYVERQRNGYFEWIDSHGLVIGADVEEERFFIREVIVVVQSVVYQGGDICQGRCLHCSLLYHTRRLGLFFALFAALFWGLVSMDGVI